MQNSKLAKTELLCLFGGRSTEYEVSLRSAYSVICNLNKDKYNVHIAGVTKEGEFYLFEGNAEDIPTDRWHLDATKLSRLKFAPGAKDPVCYEKNGEDILLPVDVVFPVMHGQNCEDGRLQGLLELCGLPFVGPGCTSSAVCMDKTITKMILSQYHIPQARSRFFWSGAVLRDVDAVISDIESAFSYPVFVKPASGGSSVGASSASDAVSLRDALLCAARFDQKVLIEEFIDAREVEVAVLGNGDELITSTPGEIDPGCEFYDYDTKYKNDTASYYVPARISENTQARLGRLAKNIYRALGCKGLSRVDFFVSRADDEAVVFNEINTLPGFTSISMYAKLFAHDGIGFSELCDRLVELALDGAPSRTDGE